MSRSPGQRGGIASRRVRKMLERQDYQCALCGRPINGGKYFDADAILICGRCALPKIQKLLE